MSEYVLYQAVLTLLFMFWWSTNGFFNCFIKSCFAASVIWSLYLMFGPMNLITKFAH